MSEAESLSLFADISADPRFAPGATLLADCREVTGTPDADELRTIANALESLTQRGFAGLAIVAKSGFVYGMARMFTAFAELGGSRVSAFRDMDAASRWLDSAGADETTVS